MSSTAQYGLPVDTIMVAGLNDIKPIVKSVLDHRAPPSNQPDSKVVRHMANELFMEKLVHSKFKETDDTCQLAGSCMYLPCTGPMTMETSLIPNT